jgi:hypothetical protein
MAYVLGRWLSLKDRKVSTILPKNETNPRYKRTKVPKGSALPD